ncbi:MAG TPA: hypothetical protein VMH86_04715 [Rhizomicrobium sp.]|nr:hypothetical protein [Rhizomicrobium sp.]
MSRITNRQGGSPRNATHPKGTEPEVRGETPDQPASTSQVYSSTEGRQKFPDFLQVTYGEKAIIGFDRYGRALGAIVPIEAVQMLAEDTHVDDDMRRRIKRTAKSLLEELSATSTHVPAGVKRELVSPRRMTAKDQNHAHPHHAASDGDQTGENPPAKGGKKGTKEIDVGRG